MIRSKILWLVGICISAILFMGCPYSSSIALSDPSYKISDNLIGTWELSGNSDGDKFEVKRTSGTTVEIIKTMGYDQSQTTFDAHITDIAGTLFLNAREGGDEYGSYYFYKIEKDGEYKIRLIPVTSYIRETFETAEEMRNFFESNMQNSYFFTTEDELYYKIK